MKSLLLNLYPRTENEGHRTPQASGLCKGWAANNSNAQNNSNALPARTDRASAAFVRIVLLPVHEW